MGLNESDAVSYFSLQISSTLTDNFLGGFDIFHKVAKYFYEIDLLCYHKIGTLSTIIA